METSSISFTTKNGTNISIFVRSINSMKIDNDRYILRLFHKNSNEIEMFKNDFINLLTVWSKFLKTGAIEWINYY